MRLSTVRITLFSVVLSLVALWAINQQDQKTQNKTTQGDAQERYSWKAFQSTTWEVTRTHEQQEQQKTTIKTDTWHYNEASKLSQFTQPIITLSTPKTITVIHSQTGETLNDEAIQLSGDVHISQYDLVQSSHRAKNDLTPPPLISTLKTQNITYNATQAELLSRDTITLTQFDSVTTGTGLFADLNTGTFQIMSNVQSTYRPSH